MKKRSLLLGMVFLFSTSAFAEMNPKSECRQILDSAQKSQREAQSNYDKANSNFSVQEREYNSSCTQNAKKPIDKAFCEGKNAKYISAKDALSRAQADLKKAYDNVKISEAKHKECMSAAVPRPEPKVSCSKESKEAAYKAEQESRRANDAYGKEKSKLARIPIEKATSNYNKAKIEFEKATSFYEKEKAEHEKVSANLEMLSSEAKNAKINYDKLKDEYMSCLKQSK